MQKRSKEAIGTTVASIGALVAAYRNLMGGDDLTAWLNLGVAILSAALATILFYDAYAARRFAKKNR